MISEKRIRDSREEKGLSRRQLAKPTPLPLFYIPRVENGRTVPSIEMFERLAQALGVSVVQLCADEQGIPVLLNLPWRITDTEVVREDPSEKERFLSRMAHVFHLLEEDDREMLLTAAQRMADRW